MTVRVRVENGFFFHPRVENGILDRLYLKAVCRSGAIFFVM